MPCCAIAALYIHLPCCVLPGGNGPYSSVGSSGVANPPLARTDALYRHPGTKSYRLLPLPVPQAGKEIEAAFFETRRYAALVGATVEFAKGEGIVYDDKAGKAVQGSTVK